MEGRLECEFQMEGQFWISQRAQMEVNCTRFKAWVYWERLDFKTGGRVDVDRLKVFLQAQSTMSSSLRA